MKAATGIDIVEYIMRPAKVIPASLVVVNYSNSKSVYFDIREIK
jgi:hypothetical protein